MPVWDPGEVGHGTQEEWAFRSRTFTAQVRGVDEAAGKLTVDLIATRERFVVDVPVGGMRVDGLSSAWQRYMPSENEYVDLAFTTLNRPRVVGMTTYMGGQDAGGYAAVAKAAENKKRGLDLVFRRLARGEFDLRSSGGAGYYFTKHGRAVIEAGTTTLELDKSRSESLGNAGLWVQRGDGVEIRFGDVKRLLPLTAVETSVSATGLPVNPTAAGAKEWRRTLSVATPPVGLPVRYLEVEEVGDVRDSLGIPVPGSYGAPLRMRRRLYDATGLIPTLTVTVDASGNTSVVQAATAFLGGVSLDLGATNPLKVSAKSVDLGGLTGVNINAGGAADSAMVRGTELALYFATKLSVLTAFGPSGPAIVPLAPGVELSLLGRLR